jgi:uncharacterized protein (DUF1330 family)
MIYAVVNLNITDKDALVAYGAVAGPALAKYGAKPAAASVAPVLLEGTATLTDRVVLLEFPDKDAALDWINDPDLKDVHALRNTIGSCDITLLV